MLARIGAGGNAAIEAFQVSAKTDKAVNAWYQWLEQRVACGAALAFA
ncbi:MAG TPA: hypothetical protein VIN38_04045 [Thiobacillus sp.]